MYYNLFVIFERGESILLSFPVLRTIDTHNNITKRILTTGSRWRRKFRTNFFIAVLKIGRGIGNGIIRCSGVMCIAATVHHIRIVFRCQIVVR